VLDAPVWLLPDMDFVSLAVPLWPEVSVVCACTPSAPHIATASDAPSRPFNNLFIFMSIS
jgi:hypothetical protein